MLLNCIITTYNRPVDIVKRAVNSALRQVNSTCEIEVVVVNDAPENTELSKRLEKEFSSMDSVRYISHEHNMGACAARNTGIRESTGEIIGFLDDDDEWLENKIEVMIPYFSNQQVAIVYSDYLYRKDQEEPPIYMKRCSEEGNQFERILVSNYIGSTSLPLLRRSAVIDVGCFDEKIKSSQDHDLWIRLLEKYKAAYCPVPTIIYSFSEVSITTKKGNGTIGYNQLLEKYSRFYKKDRALYHRRLNGIGRALLRDKNYSEALLYLLKAFLTDPLAADNYDYIIKHRRK